MPCKCENACSSCVCAKSNTLCTPECHGKRPINSVACLNDATGKQVKAMKIGDIRTAVIASNLSPIGDRSELCKRLADYLRDQKTSKPSGDSNSAKAAPTSNAVKELFNAILENEGQYELVLSLSGKEISATASKGELRKAYLLLSTKVHPDKNGQSKESVQAFQALLSAYEHLANPQKFDEDDDDLPAKKRQKTERVTRSNSGCSKTKIKCPQCKSTWGGANLGLEDAAYNFFMLAMKQYICGLCSCEFGCMTGIHFCPNCNKEFAYDPDDYHRKITCGNSKCSKEFGFWMFKVAERREREVRNEAKVKQEAEMKRIKQKNRRAKRAGNRGVTDMSANSKLQEQLFVIMLRLDCPRCGWEISRGEGSDEAKEHLENCNDEKEIAKHQKFLEKQKALKGVKSSKQATQQEIMAAKQWEHNGRQIGQLWMLSENMLVKQCKDCGLDSDGSKHEIITRLGKHLRSNARLMITDGSTEMPTEIKYDTVTIGQADEEDLPQNLHGLDKEDLQDVCASYGIKFDSKKDVKSDLIKKFESARNKGKAKLMICDKQESSESEEEDDESDEEYNVDDDE